MIHVLWALWGDRFVQSLLWCIAWGMGVFMDGQNVHIREFGCCRFEEGLV